MRKITLELERMGSLPALHKYLRRELALPVYYGANLDALYDCLTEMTDDTQLVVPAAVADDAHLGWYGKQLLQVLQDAAAANEHLQVLVK
jgi:ribonuclease inhibitor